MIDMDKTIVPKSDQMNADDLIGGKTITITVTKVSGAEGEQPIAIHYEGDKGKPYKPGKSMRRVLRQVWGRDGHAYVGRSMTLYRDPDVKFGGIAVGGIRISHMSHIDGPVTMPLTATKGSKKLFTVQPLACIPSGEARAGSAVPPGSSAAPPSAAKPVEQAEYDLLAAYVTDAQNGDDLKSALDKITLTSPRLSSDQKNDLNNLYKFHKKRIQDAQGGGDAG